MLVTQAVYDNVKKIVQYKKDWQEANAAGNLNATTTAANGAAAIYPLLPADIAATLKLCNYTQAQSYLDALTVPAPTPPPIQGRPQIKIGASGADVKYCQERLLYWGYSPGVIDGIFGVNTQNAVIAFQKSKGLSPDGIVGVNTWAALDTSKPVTPPPPAPVVVEVIPEKPAVLSTVKEGDTGAVVKYLQYRLTKYGFPCGNIDGIFGTKTKDALIAYQISRGLIPDGIAGAKTWAAIEGNTEQVETPVYPGGEGLIPDDGQYLDWTYVIIHHTQAEEVDAAAVKAYHLSLGWTDCGYNFVIERNGRIVPERPLTVKGGHCLEDNMNKKGVGVSAIGNYDVRTPGEATWHAMLMITKELMNQFKIPSSHVLGHREVIGVTKTCPGKLWDMDLFRRDLDRMTTQQINDAAAMYGVTYGASEVNELDFETPLKGIHDILAAGAAGLVGL